MTKHDTNAVTLTIFIALFAAITILGFIASRWRRAKLDHLNEWGLGGRTFGTIVTWFLLGGDLYTAYTFIAVPALVFGVGAAGFFALPYTIIVYPFVFVVMPRLWAVAHRRGYVTPADFVRGRSGSSTLALAVALTGIVATMPYIALQLVGIQVILQSMGISGDWPLVIAFAILAAYTYQSGLRAPALIAVVKDLLIYITIIAGIVVFVHKLGGFGSIFDAADKALPKKTGPTGAPGALIPGSGQAQQAYASLAFGSALALFMYPHAVTGVLSSRSANTIRRNAAILPAYSFLLGLLALFGLAAIAAGLNPSSPNFAVPDLYIRYFPHWFEGVAFGAIAIGALVPAAVMSIAAANLFTRNVYKEYLRRDATPQNEATVAKIASLFVKVGALVFVIVLPNKYAIDLQLLGGVWILQTLPSVVIGLYTRWQHRWALLAGWAVGMSIGTWMAVDNAFKGSTYTVTFFGTSITLYEALWGFMANLVVTFVVTLVLRATRAPEGSDETVPEDYVEIGEVRGAEPLPATPEEAPAGRA